MGLFGKKLPDGIGVSFYDGDLREFPIGCGCQLLLMDDYLRITKIKPYVEVKLDRSRITSLEMISEVEYMAKYKGATVPQVEKNPRCFYVFHFVDKEGNNKHLDFWGTIFENSKVRKIKDALLKDKENKGPVSYDL